MLTAVDVAVAAAAGAGAFVFAVLAVRRQTRTALPGRRAAAVLWVTSALCAATAVLTVARPGWPYWGDQRPTVGRGRSRRVAGSAAAGGAAPVAGRGRPAHGRTAVPRSARLLLTRLSDPAASLRDMTGRVLWAGPVGLAERDQSDMRILPPLPPAGQVTRGVARPQPGRPVPSRCDQIP